MLDFYRVNPDEEGHKEKENVTQKLENEIKTPVPDVKVNYLE